MTAPVTALQVDSAFDQVDFEIAAYRAMSKTWKPVQALVGGTESIRELKEVYLPKEPGESTESYETRVKRSFLFAAYRDTLEHLAGRPFQREVILGEDAPGLLHDWTSDIDLEGSSLTHFSREVLKAAIHFGLTHLLVEFPTIPRGISLAEEREIGARPYFCHITPDSVIGWRSVRFAGSEVLTQLRIRETLVRADGEFGEEEVHRIRVYRRSLPGELMDDGTPVAPGVTFEVWERTSTDGNRYRIVEGPDAISLGRIPIHTLYSVRTGFMTGFPMLQDLAWKNIEHWQSASDQRNILHVARVPFLFGSGITEEDLGVAKGGTVQLGSNRMIMANNPDAKLGHVEHTGKSIGSGESDLAKIEEQMVALGMKPLVMKPGTRTATESSINESEATSDLKALSRRLESMLSHAFGTALEWVSQAQEEPVPVDVYSEFLAMGSGDAKELTLARARGDISRRTWWDEMKRRSILSESFDPENESELLESETAVGMGSMQVDDDDQDDGEETSLDETEE